MRYVIEIDTEHPYKRDQFSDLVYSTDVGFIEESDLENLEELNSDYINEHFPDLQDTAYKKGLEDGKAQSERGCDGCRFEGTEICLRPCISRAVLVATHTPTSGKQSRPMTRLR